MGKLLNRGMSVLLKEVETARERIKRIIQKTPLSFSRSCSQRVGSKVYLKFENEQITGSFKLRGACNKILSLPEKDRARGIVCASAGNHAQGVAYAANYTGAKAHVVMPVHSPMVKVLATKSYGAEVILRGDIYDEAYAYAQQLEKDKGYTFVHPFEDPMVIAGQGTIGLEILEDLPDVDSVIVPVGGGGLIAGIASVIKEKKPSCKIYGVVPSNFPSMKYMFKGEPVPEGPFRPTVADGAAVKYASQMMHDKYLTKYVDDIISITEAEIAEAIVFLLERAKTVVEGAGALALAAASHGKWALGQKCALILSGGNIDVNILSKVIEKGLAQVGRLARINVIVTDRPGTLQKLTAAIAESGANIMQVNHDRLASHLQLRETGIEFLLETRDEDHVQQIREALHAAGARIHKTSPNSF